MESSGVKWVRLGDYIEQFRHKCANNKAIVSGVDINKRFIPTRANLDGTDISGYYLVPPTFFACNLMHIGRDERIPIAYNDTDKDLVVTSAYYVFHIKQDKCDEILNEYLYIIFSNKEIDRLTWFYTDSSIRGNLKENRFLDIKMPLPSVAEQQKVVNAWRAFREIKEQNEAKAAPLMQLCQSYIQEIRKKKNVRNYRIGNAIEVIDKTNKDGSPYEVLGLNNNKMFMPTVASMDTINTSKYKIIRKGEFAFSGMQTGRDKCIRIALYDKDIPALISPAYATFILDKEEPILPEYFMMIFKNPEMDRLGWFYSDSSVRANLDWNRFIDIEIPLPPIEVQQAIVNIYKCANKAKLIAEEADRLSREVCPALLQHVIHS